MTVELTVADADSGGASHLRDLRSWLLRDHEFRGRVRLREDPPPPEALGAITAAVEVALGPGGALTALAGAIIVWLRSRKGSLTIKLTRNGDSVELSAQGLRDLNPTELSAIITHTVNTLADTPTNRVHRDNNPHDG